MTSLWLRKPGLFITGTDTGVGKTVVTCAIAAAIRRSNPGVRVGVCKPIATGCRREREGLVSEDAEAIAYFSDSRLPLDVINPVRYSEPLAPAVAAQRAGEPVDQAAIADSMRQVDAGNDLVLVEGVGGLLTPIDAGRSVLDIAGWLGYPVVVVTRAGLGTLNHTALTCRAIREAKLRLAGLVINRFRADTTDLAEVTNAQWLANQNNTTVLATLPETSGVEPQRASLPEEVIAAAEMVDWLAACRSPQW